MDRPNDARLLRAALELGGITRGDLGERMTSRGFRMKKDTIDSIAAGGRPINDPERQPLAEACGVPIDFFDDSFWQRSVQGIPPRTLQEAVEHATVKSNQELKRSNQELAEQLSEIRHRVDDLSRQAVERDLEDAEQRRQGAETSAREAADQGDEQGGGEA